MAVMPLARSVAWDSQWILKRPSFWMLWCLREHCWAYTGLYCVEVWRNQAFVWNIPVEAICTCTLCICTSLRLNLALCARAQPGLHPQCTELRNLSEESRNAFQKTLECRLRRPPRCRPVGLAPRCKHLNSTRCTSKILHFTESLGRSYEWQ